ncbi:hypothetical protein FHS72_003309 [Loktanella ponticola]|uniref:Uncharacterized protein n=1 Tax=Yoonia ponticola TaxID=1524255 RepID=A0A7W9BNA6_9RHOB|nr:hypothetical protein [Yoonia ponticola]
MRRRGILTKKTALKIGDQDRTIAFLEEIFEG